MAWPESSCADGTPIQQSVVYASPDPDTPAAQYKRRLPRYTDAREGRPNADVLARTFNLLDGATGGIVPGSGMATVAAVLMGSARGGQPAGPSLSRLGS